MDKRPLLTLLTVTYNCEDSLNKTLSSVKSDSPLVEHLFIDGKSNDSTLDIINNYCSHQRIQTSLISENDKGIYDALNKGSLLAQGEYILVLHSGDEIILPIDEILEALNDKADIYAFGGKFIDNKGVIVPWLRKNFPLTMINPAIRHPTLIISSDLLRTNGGYDLSYKISADYDFICRVLKKNSCKILVIEKPLLLMEEFGFSGSRQRFILKKKEHLRISQHIENIGLRLKFKLKIILQMMTGYISLLKREWKSQL